MKYPLILLLLALLGATGCKKECYFCTVGSVNTKVCEDDALYTPISKKWKVVDGTTGEEYKCK